MPPVAGGSPPIQMCTSGILGFAHTATRHAARATANAARVTIKRTCDRRLITEPASCGAEVQRIRRLAGGCSRGERRSAGSSAVSSVLRTRLPATSTGSRTPRCTRGLHAHRLLIARWVATCPCNAPISQERCQRVSLEESRTYWLRVDDGGEGILREVRNLLICGNATGRRPHHAEVAVGDRARLFQAPKGKDGGDGFSPPTISALPNPHPVGGTVTKTDRSSRDRAVNRSLPSGERHAYHAPETQDADGPDAEQDVDRAHEALDGDRELEVRRHEGVERPAQG